MAGKMKQFIIPSPSCTAVFSSAFPLPRLLLTPAMFGMKVGQKSESPAAVILGMFTEECRMQHNEVRLASLPFINR